VLSSLVTLRVLDEHLVACQRDGELPFYASLQGEEAAVLGSLLSLSAADTVFATPRECIGAFSRGLDMEALLCQLFGKEGDPAKGRQAPGHLVAPTVKWNAASGIAGAHLAHAAGFAWAARTQGDSAIALAFFGDGATSTADFHNGLNFAAVFGARVVFVCRNNGFARSLPVDRQTLSKELADKAVAYGMPQVRADGNDVFAVFDAVSSAVRRARDGDGPTLVELVTKRLEDDAAACPIARLAKDSQGALDAALGDARKRAEAAVSLALAKVRALPNAHAPFTDDVFAAPAR
jgi:2-oxoisovalerate dehydrogenase E1 component alpha subunit